MALRVYILGDAAAYQNYTLAVERAGGIPCFGSRPADCDCLLLPGGGDMESWRYGQKNTACRDLEPERDALELELLAHFTALDKPVLGICRGMQTINVFFGGDLVQDWPGHSAIEGVDRLHSVQKMHCPFCGSYTESAAWSTVATTRSLAAWEPVWRFCNGRRTA